MDLIMLFKITHNLVAFDFLGLTNYTSTRGHNYKLIKPICNNNARQFSFACSLIDELTHGTIYPLTLEMLYLFQVLKIC